MAQIDRDIFWYGAFSQKFGPAVARNGSLSFVQCVRPGGRPTHEHSLAMLNLPAPITSLIAGSSMLLIVTLNPVTALFRPLYPEHRQGVNKNDWFGLIWLFLRHPLVVQGEGPSNGDGLAAMNGAETLIYPVTPKSLLPGPADSPYWLKEGKPPRFRDIFHDKLFCHRFFEAHNAPHPICVAHVVNDKRDQIFVEQECAPKKLIWKPRYSTMSLGVEHFTWEGCDKPGWAPLEVPYLIEEFIQSSEYDAAEWYRMTTLWEYSKPGPMVGYCWRTRNSLGDARVQTDIIGGVYCVTEHKPFVGPKGAGKWYCPRSATNGPLDPQVEKALARAIELQLEMHKALGKELWSIGWDVMVRDGVPLFIEFNINNGFYCADHPVEEVYQMIDYYTAQFNARIGPQLLDFDHTQADQGK
eukprot:CAMPEP_0175139708 /NCGR_PEP_ID=MMETSP0087-20121206/11062_1 /TAXON_ID=136419 /ORGANISM="Unknown Unknown, Strain D1" /LENGTH=411 /DNA_ID=CAMNT_0016422767 /DNA_START=85 /DNA_END=1320 /DNA_ORIENTATION=+